MRGLPYRWIGWILSFWRKTGSFFHFCIYVFLPSFSSIEWKVEYDELDWIGIDLYSIQKIWWWMLCEWMNMYLKFYVVMKRAIKLSIFFTWNAVDFIKFDYLIRSFSRLLCKLTTNRLRLALTTTAVVCSLLVSTFMDLRIFYSSSHRFHFLFLLQIFVKGQHSILSFYLLEECYSLVRMYFSSFLCFPTVNVSCVLCFIGSNTTILDKGVLWSATLWLCWK